jgi:phosphoesterase RecJ-like protein
MIQASDTLKRFGKWALFTHKRADGDAVGSAAGLFEVGLTLGKTVTWCSHDPLPDDLSFVPHFDECRVCEKLFPFTDGKTLYVFLDCAGEERSVDGLRVRDRGTTVLNIDHHEDNTMYGDVNCVSPKSSSTAEVLYLLLRCGGFPINEMAAKCMYLGICTDTGGFAFSNTSPLTHRAAAELIEAGNIDPSAVSDRITQTQTPGRMALWARAFERVEAFGHGDNFIFSNLVRSDFAETGTGPADTEGLVNMLMRIRGAEFVALFTEQLKENTIRVSFRSRGGPFCAGEVARIFGGGGHEKAAGATMAGPLDMVMGMVADILEKSNDRDGEEWNNSDR